MLDQQRCSYRYLFSSNTFTGRHTANIMKEFEYERMKQIRIYIVEEKERETRTIAAHLSSKIRRRRRRNTSEH
jgi:hypothetical protein